MNPRLIPRTAAVALAVLVTALTLSGIDALAVNGHAGHAMMAASPASAATLQAANPAATKARQTAEADGPAPRS